MDDQHPLPGGAELDEDPAPSTFKAHPSRYFATPAASKQRTDSPPAQDHNLTQRLKKISRGEYIVFPNTAGFY